MAENGDEQVAQVLPFIQYLLPLVLSALSLVLSAPALLLSALALLLSALALLLSALALLLSALALLLPALALLLPALALLLPALALLLPTLALLLPALALVLLLRPLVLLPLSVGLLPVPRVQDPFAGILAGSRAARFRRTPILATFRARARHDAENASPEQALHSHLANPGRVRLSADVGGDCLVRRRGPAAFHRSRRTHALLSTLACRARGGRLHLDDAGPWRPVRGRPPRGSARGRRRRDARRADDRQPAAQCREVHAAGWRGDPDADGRCHPRHPRVRDDGTGIDAALLPHVFDAFVQGEGTLSRTEGGLGLAELHGGTAHADSGGKEKGAEFTVRLPLLAAITAEPSATPQTERIPS